MSDPTNTDVMAALHQHDVRLVRLEGKVDSLDRDVTHQGTRMDRATTKLEELAESVARLGGGQKIILAIVGIGIPAIIGLEVWAKLGL